LQAQWPQWIQCALLVLFATCQGTLWRLFTELIPALLFSGHALHSFSVVPDEVFGSRGYDFPTGFDEMSVECCIGVAGCRSRHWERNTKTDDQPTLPLFAPGRFC
jgi:hypothetical protein